MQLFYTFDFLYISGNTISSNRTSMHKRQITVQPVVMHIFNRMSWNIPWKSSHICNQQSESTLHMSNVAHKTLHHKATQSCGQMKQQADHQRSSGPSGVGRLGKWSCTMYMYIHRVVQIDKLIITIILFSIIKYPCIMIRLILFINLYLNPRELTLNCILWHHRISIQYMHKNWITISKEFYHIKLLCYWDDSLF